LALAAGVAGAAPSSPSFSSSSLEDDGEESSEEEESEEESDESADEEEEDKELLLLLLRRFLCGGGGSEARRAKTVAVAAAAPADPLPPKGTPRIAERSEAEYPPTCLPALRRANLARWEVAGAAPFCFRVFSSPSPSLLSLPLSLLPSEEEEEPEEEDDDEEAAAAFFVAFFFVLFVPLRLFWSPPPSSLLLLLLSLSSLSLSTLLFVSLAFTSVSFDSSLSYETIPAVQALAASSGLDWKFFCFEERRTFFFCEKEKGRKEEVERNVGKRAPALDNTPSRVKRKTTHQPHPGGVRLFLDADVLLDALARGALFIVIGFGFRGRKAEEVVSAGEERAESRRRRLVFRTCRLFFFLSTNSGPKHSPALPLRASPCAEAA
jgi:hypothetical protein